MAINRLSAGTVEGELRRKIKTPKMLHDGGGLYLQVARSGSISWIFRFKSPATGKSRDMGLGAAHKMLLADAREEAARLRRMIHVERLDPIEERKKAGQSGVTFRKQFDYMIGLEPRPGWKEMLAIHAMPAIGDKRIDAISTADVTAIIAGLLARGKHETARKLQQRIHAVIRSATGSIDTPAHKARICHTLRSFAKVKKNKPFPSLDFETLPTFMAQLRERPEIAARALEFTILTACRTGDVLGVYRKRLTTKPPLYWRDIDLRRRVWTVPAVKTADERDPQPFEIPLSDAALDVLRRVQAMGLSREIVFPSVNDGLMHTSYMRRVLGALAPGKTVHGFRATFRTFVSGKFERDVIETALAHAVFSENKAEAAYKSRVKFFDKRSEMMQAWGEYATKVVALKAAA